MLLILGGANLGFSASPRVYLLGGCSSGSREVAPSALQLFRLTIAGAFSIMPTCQEWSNVRRMGSPSQPLYALTC